ncbi:MAG TPA: Fic family protein [Anaeromyxobacter sp.]
MPRFENRRWEADFSAPGAKKNRRSFTYKAFVPDALEGFAPSLPAATVALVSDAEQTVQTLNLDPPQLASLEVVARRLLRAEAVASSSIEGLKISQRRLAEAELGADDARDVTAKSVLGNVAAMDAALELGSSKAALQVSDVLEIHRLLMESTDHPDRAGKLRTTQNWIGGTSYNPLNAVFVPPPPELVESLMEDLVRFASRSDLPAAVQAAVAHAQFETIHPFGDGNGRTGRALIHVVLRRRGLTPRFVPPVSLVLATNASEYIAGLTAFREGRLTGWLDGFARALRSAAKKSADLARDIAAMQAAWRQRAGNPRADSSAEGLIVALPAYPVLTAASAAKVLDRSVQAANTALAVLENAGVLKQVSLGRRNRAFEAPELLNLVSAFERELAIPDTGGSPPRPRHAARRR